MEKYKEWLKKSLTTDHDTKNVRMCKAIVYRIIDDCVFSYEKRINRNSLEEIAELRKKLDKEHKKLQ